VLSEIGQAICDSAVVAVDCLEQDAEKHSRCAGHELRWLIIGDDDIDRVVMVSRSGDGLNCCAAGRGWLVEFRWA
jgi:hypothetical protein